MPVKITTRVGHLNDPRVHKNANGSYSAKGVRGTFSTWLELLRDRAGEHPGYTIKRFSCEKVGRIGKA